MGRAAVSGENMSRAYFWCWDGLIVRDAGVAAMVDVLAGLVASDEVRTVLRPVAAEPEV